jgi:aromatic-L-amino-acid decarboxylase
VRAQVKPGGIAAKLPHSAPATPESMANIFQDFQDIVMPGIIHWQHPNFFAYFPANSSPPSVLAEMLTATLGTNFLLWQTSPAATEMETRVLDWPRQMIGLDSGFTGVIQDSASSASLCAILSARERASGWRTNEDGLSSAAPMAVYTSSETHSSVEKDAKVAGIGRQFVRQIPVDADFAMRPDALAEAIATNRANGVTPALVHRHLGHDGSGRNRPPARHRRHQSAGRCFSACGRSLGGQRTYSQRFQMDADKFRLLGTFCSRPGHIGANAFDSAGIPSNKNGRQR